MLVEASLFSLHSNSNHLALYHVLTVISPCRIVPGGSPRERNCLARSFNSQLVRAWLRGPAHTQNYSIRC